MRCFSLLILLLLAWLATLGAVPPVRHPQDATPTPQALTPAELITMINRIRTGRGLPALIVDPILMGTAQSTADIMAGFRMTGHIGDVRGRVMSAGYGAGDIPWATENFAVLPMEAGANIILQIWSDDLHMKPMADPNYRHIGAGVSVISEEAVYYIVHAANTSNRTYKPNANTQPGALPANSISQYIFAVQTATPQPDGELLHVVKQGQSLWSIAIAYQTHIDVLQQLNGMGREKLILYTGQKLRIPTAQPTPEKTVAIQEVAAATAAAAAEARGANEIAQAGSGEPDPTGPQAPASEVGGPAVGTPAPIPSIPDTGDSLNQTILTVLIALGLSGIALIMFGIVVKK